MANKDITATVIANILNLIKTASAFATVTVTQSKKYQTARREVFKTSMPKTATKASAKPTTKAKPLTGPAAVRELQRQVSPAGVKKAEINAKKAIAKKYPDLTKKK